MGAAADMDAGLQRGVTTDEARRIELEPEDRDSRACGRPSRALAPTHPVAVRSSAKPGVGRRGSASCLGSLPRRSPISSAECPRAWVEGRRTLMVRATSSRGRDLNAHVTVIGTT
jgi:hypothetical protein